MAVDPITGAENVVDDLIKAVSSHITDPNERAELIAKIQSQAMAAAQASDQAQLAAIAAEAQTKGLLNKPHLILAAMCLFAIGFDLVLAPLVMWIAYSLGFPIPAPPKLDQGELQLLAEITLGGGAIHLAHAGYKSWLATS